MKKLLNSIPLVQNYFSGMIAIFMLHRVHPFESDKLSPNENMKISPEFLENFIIELKTKGYEFISLDRVHEILQNGEKVKKQIVFTLDDGYKDNYEMAYPIFKKHNVPFTIYITTSFPQKEAILWWYVLEDVLAQNDEVIFAGEKYSCKSVEENNELFLKIRSFILAFEKDNFKERLYKLFENYQVDWEVKCKELCMNWEQIIELSKDELCTIAGHTKNHFVFNKLDKEEIISEIVDANKLIEEKLGKKVEHFAYPFGSSHEVEQREFDIIKELGFKTATTTRQGTVYQEHKDYLECLPRIMLTENFDLKNIGKIRRTRIVTI